MESFGQPVDEEWIEALRAEGFAPEDAAELSRQLPAKSLSSLFDSTDYDTNIVNTGSAVIPPDAHGAAGPDHLVNVANVTIRFHGKDATLLYDESLQTFFADIAPLTLTFDPKVLYDQVANRWVVVTLEKTEIAEGFPSNTSRLLIAVSDDADPNGAWHASAIDTKINVGGVDHWADYPGLAIDEEAVYVTANLFAFGTNAFGGTRQWVIDKGLAGGFYGGGALSSTVLDLVGAIGGFQMTLQPAHVYGAPAPGIGTWFAGYSGLSSSGTSALQLLRLDNPLGSPSVAASLVTFGGVDALSGPLPEAEQAGTSTKIAVNDRRALDALWRDGSLWLTTTLDSLDDPGQASAYWLEVDPAGTGTVVDQGALTGEDIAPQASTFFPSIAVNVDGEVAVGFSASASSIFPGAYFATRSPADPAGTMGPSRTLRAGVDYYERTFGSGRNRWGDYSGTAWDPSTDCFWIYNEYARSRGSVSGGEDGRWSTTWGETCVCQGDVSTLDLDYDDICADLDNCPQDANPSQADADGDGNGDACDLCIGDDATGDSDGDGLCDDLDTPASGAEIDYSPPAMAFGPQEPEDGPTAFQILTVTNEGTEDLDFNFRIAGDDADEFGRGRLDIEGAGSTVSINPDGSLEVKLTPGGLLGARLFFDPETTGSKLGQVEITSNDADESLVVVPLLGNPGPLDYGDAPSANPAPAYPTLLTQNGARHPADSGLFLGQLVDAEADGQPNAAATGDDLAGLDDEDGVILSPIPMAPPASASPRIDRLKLGASGSPRVDAVVGVLASAASWLNAWVDWNQDGDWLDADEQVFLDQPLAAGFNPALTYGVPAGAASGGTYARFRVSSSPGLGFGGAAADGEVEDYRVIVGGPDVASLYVLKAASPTVVTEPGGIVTFTVGLYNVSATESVTVNSLVDDVHGNLDGRGTCTVPLILAPNAFVECSFSASVSGNAGDSEIDTVTAGGVSATGTVVEASDTARVDITDVPPALAVTLTASPATVPEPGASVSYTVVVSNDSGAESLSLDGLIDDLGVDLDGRGSCVLPQALAVGGSYACTYDAAVSGNAGAVVTATITATVSDDDGNVAQDSGAAAVSVTDVLPEVAVSTTPSLAVVPEPGEAVTFVVEVVNLSLAEAVEIVALASDVHGALDGQGSCALPRTLAAGGVYACSYTATVSGNAGFVETSTVLTTGFDDEENAAQSDDSAVVTIADVPPSLVVTKTALRTTVIEPGGFVTFALRIDNTSVSTDPVTVTSLVDDVHGPVNGQGICEMPQQIGAGSFYECSFKVLVSGAAGEVEVDTVTAGGQDDEGTLATAADSAVVTVLGRDYGDAPDPSYPTLLENNGARHVLGSGLILGFAADTEIDGQPDTGAVGDDLDGGSDDDGVSLASPNVPGNKGHVAVTVSGQGRLSAWVDWNQDGDWQDPGEQIVANRLISAGAGQLVAYQVPTSAVLGTTFTRFRFSSAGGLGPGGEAIDGEVEDYVLSVVEALFVDGFESGDVTRWSAAVD